MRFKPWMLHGIAHRLCPVDAAARSAIADQHFGMFSELYERQGITRAAHVRAGLVCDDAAIRSMARDLAKPTTKKKG